MASEQIACPKCGSSNTSPAVVVWETGNQDPTTPSRPPVPRRAVTNAGRFYGFTLLWMVIIVLVTLFLRHHAAHRPESVLMVTVIGVGFCLLLVVRTFTHGPRPTADELAALDEWAEAHEEWERSRVCLDCNKLFTASGGLPPF